MRWGSRHLVALSVVAALACSLAWTGSAGALVTTAQPHLSLNRLIRTSPFVGSTTSVRDNEDTAYVAGDDSLWIADDNGDAIYEINRTTGALRRMISQSTFINSHQLGGSNTAGQSRTEDLEALAYDANADVLYAFSGSTERGSHRVQAHAGRQPPVPDPVVAAVAVGVDRCGLAPRRRSALRREQRDPAHLRLREQHVRAELLHLRAVQGLRHRLRRRHRRPASR